jgi:hypothetical protein
MSAPPPAPPSRPRIVDVAFWLWLAASILLVAFGMLLALAQPGIPALWRGVGVVYALAGLGLGYLAGRTRAGDARFRRAAVALALTLVVLLAVFALISHGVIWLLILVLTMAGAVLVMRPSAAVWFETTEEM